MRTPQRVSEGVQRVRDRWLAGSPAEKLGVTERYVIFGEARRWVLEKLSHSQADLVLDVGFGHGFLSFEAASTLDAQIIGIDFTRGEQVRIATGGLKLAKLLDRVSWVTGDARMMPFPKAQFDAVVSFNTLQDPCMTGGLQALMKTLEESSRVLKPRGLLCIADNLYPECARTVSQKLYAKIHRDEFRAVLPSKEQVLQKLKENGLEELVESRYDPKVTLSGKEAGIELRDVVEARPFGMDFDFETLWGKHGMDVNRTGLSYPDVLLIMGKRGKNFRF